MRDLVVGDVAAVAASRAGDARAAGSADPAPTLRKHEMPDHARLDVFRSFALDPTGEGGAR